MGYKNYEQQKAAHASMAEKKKSPAKLVPTITSSVRKKRKTQEDIRNEHRKSRSSYKNKAASQMAKYRGKKAQAEAAVRGKMSEKDMMQNESVQYDSDGPNVTVYGKKKSPAKKVETLGEKETRDNMKKGKMPGFAEDTSKTNIQKDAAANQRKGGTHKKIKAEALKTSPFKLKPKSPLMGKISAACKARAKKKFKVWPSAYASGWGVRCTQGKV